MGLNCIIIDDSQFIRETVTLMIENAGNYKVTHSFANGPDFLNALTNLEAPDVVFCDIILPEMTGLDLLNIIKEGFPSTKIVMLSGVTQTEAISAALRLGAIDFLQKPVEKERLVELLIKLSNTSEPPSVEQLSTIGVASEILNGFFEEMAAHSASTLRKVVNAQVRSILEDVKGKTAGMLMVDVMKMRIEPDPGLWGVYSEDQVMNQLQAIPDELQFELQFLYSDEFVDNLYSQAIMTMGAKKRHAQLFEKVSPMSIGLPPTPQYSDPNTEVVEKAGTTFEELDKSISIAFFVFDSSGPQIQSRINTDLLTEADLMRNSIFYYTLVGEDDNIQEGLFGPLPVSSEFHRNLSSLAYTTTKPTQSGNNKIIILSIFYTPVAERLVGDYNKLSFVIRTNLASAEMVEDIDKLVLRGIIDDTIAYLLES